MYDMLEFVVYLKKKKKYLRSSTFMQRASLVPDMELLHPE